MTSEHWRYIQKAKVEGYILEILRPFEDYSVSRNNETEGFGAVAQNHYSYGTKTIGAVKAIMRLFEAHNPNYEP